MLNVRRWLRREEKDGALSGAENTSITRLDEALCRMVDLRHSVDPRLRNEKPADHWPMFRVWRTQEGMIANIVEFSQTLQDDGYSEVESIEKLLLGIPLSLDSCAHDLFSYIRLRLEKVDPEYLALGPELLDQAVTLAKIGADIEIQNRKSSSGFPPAQWFREKLSCDEIIDDSIYEHITDENYKTLGGILIPIRKNSRYALLPQSKHESRDWIRFQLRMRPDDEIWTFGGSLLGNGTSFRAGVALLRQGKVIDRVSTIKG